MSSGDKDDIAQYEPGTVQVGNKDLAEYYRFNLKQMEFLLEYSKDLDAERSAKEVDVNPKTAGRWMGEPKFKAEVMEIHDAWRHKIKMTSEAASLRLIKNLQKFEDDYDNLDLEERSKMASPIAKTLDIYMRATNAYNKDTEDKSQVVINIDLGGDKENEQRVSISGESKKKSKDD